MRDHADTESTPSSPAKSPLGRTALLCILSLIAMLPWPAAGTVLAHTYFDNWFEVFFMLGGLTAFPAIVVALFGAPDSVYVAIMVIDWIGAWIAPPFIWLRRRSCRGRVLVILGSQSLFAMVQAMMGVLMVVGKSV